MPEDLPGFLNDGVGVGVQGSADGGDQVLVVLDVMLPGLNGFDVLRRIRDASNIPVLLLTARGEDVDRLIQFIESSERGVIK